MEPSYKILIKIGSLSLGSWLPVSHKRGLFIGQLGDGYFRILRD